MRWRTTIAITTLTLLLLLAPFFPRSNDETFQSSEESKRINSKPAKLYHGMNKKYRPGDEPDMQINITVKMQIWITPIKSKKICKECSEHWIIKNMNNLRRWRRTFFKGGPWSKQLVKSIRKKKCLHPSVIYLFKVWPRAKNPPEVV